MSRAAINPDLLKWALDRAALGDFQVAQKVGVKEEYLLRLKDGKELPTFRQAKELARVLHIPLGYLFLSTPPKTVSPIADFRTLPNTQHGHFSLELEDTLNDAMRKQDWLREWRIQEGEEPLPFIGKYSIKSAPELVAEDIRSTLNIPLLPAKRINNVEDQFRFYIKQTEDAGILILQNGVALNNNQRPLSVKEFRGFNLSDSYAPVIFINGCDSFAGRLFTLVHECAHLWSGTSGISNPSFSESIDAPGIEHFCNLVAAEVLVPSKSFLSQWNIQTQYDLLVKAQNLSKFFKVSVFVILIRSRELGFISYDVFKKAYSEAEDRIEPIKKRNTDGGDFFNTMRARNGRILVRDLVVALRQGNILYREAAQLLNVYPKTLEGIMQRY